MSWWTGLPAGSPSWSRLPARGEGRRGFTLIEVLAALAILGLALGVLFQIFSTGLGSARVAQGYTLATALAESKLASLGIEEPLAEGETAGWFDDDFRWRVAVRSYEQEARAAGEGASIEPYEVVVTVSWGEPDEERSVSLTTLRLAPSR